MISQLKAKLRAWLIDLVREAIRVELAKYSNPLTSPAITKIVGNAPRIPFSFQTASKPVTATVTEFPDKTFEQLQAESIAAQENYYAPKVV